MSLEYVETMAVSYLIHVTYESGQIETLYAASFQEAASYAKSVTDIIHNNPVNIRSINVYPFKQDPDHPGIARVVSDQPVYTISLHIYTGETSTTTASSSMYPTQLLPTQPHKYMTYVSNYHPPKDKKGEE